MEFVGHLPRYMPDTIPCGLIIWTSLQDMFSCLTAGTEVRFTNFEYVKYMAAESVIVSFKSEYIDLFLTRVDVVCLFKILVSMLLCPILFYIAIEKVFFYSNHFMTFQINMLRFNRFHLVVTYWETRRLMSCTGKFT